MKRRKTYIISLAVLVLLILSRQHVFSQTNTMYYMGTLPQSYYLNPATQPFCDLYFGAPIVSHAYLRGTTGGINTSEVLLQDPASDSIILPFHPNASIDDFLNSLKDVESFNVDMSVNLASLGFRVKEMFFSFDATLKNDVQLAYSKDLADFLVKGNYDGQTFDFSDGGINALSYLEFGLNVSRRFGDQLQVGIRPKLLYGIGAISTLANNTSLNTSTDEWVLNTDYQARLSVSGLSIPVDAEGNIDLEGDFEFDSTIYTTSSGYKKMLKNRGFGIDLGAHYKPIENLQVSLSLLDLGYIKWRDYTHVASLDGSYTFNGYDINFPDSIDYVESLLDTVKANLKLSGSDEAFTTGLTPKLLVGGRYFLTPGVDVGILYRADFYRTYVNHDLLLLANWHPIPMISVSGSYSLLNKTHSTIGLGIGLRLGPFNYYMVFDDIPLRYDLATSDGSSFPIPVGLTDFNIRFGFNLVFGCNQLKKLKQDKPLFSSSDWIL